MSKSLEDIMRQMEAQKSAEQQRRLVEERALNEQREIQRRLHSERIRMYEASVNFNNTSSSAGAGGGGNRILDNTTNEFIENDYVENYFE
jgi:hypothetical protein